MKRKNVFKNIGIVFLASSVILSCSKKDDTVDPVNPYKTSTGKLLTATDSVDGELGEPTAEVIYSMKGTEHGISFKCYDQTTKPTDTSYADIAVYFAFTKQDLINENYKDTVYPTKTDYESKNFGIQDSLYLKVIKDSRSSVNDQVGKYSIKVIQNTLAVESATAIQVNDANYTTASQTVKGASGKYYETWYKANVTPGKTYYVRYLRSVDDGAYSLVNFNCEFYGKDGVTVHPGTDITKGGEVDIAPDNTYYVIYTVPTGQSILYIKCFSNIAGTNGVKIVDIKP